LTTISNCICKQNKKSSKVAAIRKSSLLKAFSAYYSIDILSCNNCVVYRIQSCRISSQDISRYEEYILCNCSNYNVLDVLDKQLFYFVLQYAKLKSEVQITIEKLLRL